MCLSYLTVHDLQNFDIVVWPVVAMGFLQGIPKTETNNGYLKSLMCFTAGKASPYMNSPSTVEKDREQFLDGFSLSGLSEGITNRCL